MVCFSCAACGESMKKAQVENHRRQCRGCKSMSCLDCGKEFRGEEYQMHLKCITEKEKYGSKDFDAKQGKGNSKQSQSLEQVKQAIESCRVSTKALPILQCLVQLQSIPLKKRKCQNYLQNSLKVTDCEVVDEIWNVISIKNLSEQKPKQIQKSGAGTLDSTLEKEDTVNEKVEGAMKLDKNSKREKKRKRKEKKEAESAGEVCEQEERSRTKKQKSEDATDADVELNNENPSVEKKKKKKKKSTDKDSENCGVENDKQKQKKKEQVKKGAARLKCESEDLDAEVQGEKFSWKSAIKSILQEAEGNQMSAKKLRKKVIAQYQVHTSGKPTLSENELKTNFDKMAEGTLTKKKRKLLDENRSFKKEWEAFFFVECKGKALCIICHETIALMKVCNVKRHCTSVHPKQAALSDDKKKAEFGHLSAQLEKQSAFTKRSVSSTQAAAQSNTRASYRVAHLVATNLKPFNEGEFLKECMMAVVEDVCPDKSREFAAISLSARSLTRRIEEMAADFRGTLKDMSVRSLLLHRLGRVD